MLFKDIENFEDLNEIDNSKLSDLIWDDNTSISAYNKIKLSELKYDTPLSEMIFFLIKTAQERKQEDLDRCFKCSLKYLKNNDIHFINHFSYIIKMLILLAKIYKLNIEHWITEYKTIISTIDNSLNLIWLGEVLIKAKLCDENVVNHILSNLTWQHEKDFLDLLKLNCKNIDSEILYLNYAEKLEKIASKEQDMKAIYFYELAIEIHNKYNRKEDIDRIKLIKNEIPFNLKEHTITLSSEKVQKFKIYIDELKQKIDIKISQDKKEEAFNIVFSNISLVNKNETISNTINNQSVFRLLGDIISIGDGTKIIFTKEEDKQRYLEFENYQISLNIYTDIFSQLLEHIKSEIDIYDIIIDIYQESQIFEETKNLVILDLINRHKNKDIIGFNYIFNPMFEYLLKEILKLNNISPYKTDKEEDKTLGKLLDKNKKILEEIYGEDFYYLLENLFSYKFGLNIRNSLLHGEGMSFLNKKYNDILFYVLVILITYVRRVKDV
jgi:hypothetical protein